MIFSPNDKNEKGNIMFTTSYKYRLSVVAALLVASTLNAGQVGTLTNFEANTTAKASEVNHNFIVLKDAVNDNDTRLSTKQDRVDDACGAGFYMQSVNADGSVVCQQDMDTNTVYTDGIGLSLTGTTFNVDTTAIQSRITSSCAAGSSIRAIYADGTVTCELDTDTNSGGDITGVTASGGLTGGGTSGDVTVKRASGSVSINSTALIAFPRDKCLMKGSPLYTYFIASETTYNYCDGYTNPNLPDGAIITNLTCKVYSNDDTSTDSVYVGLHRRTFNGSLTELAYIATNIDSDLTQTISDTTIVYSRVDNRNYMYVLKYNPPNTTSTAEDKNRFYNCRIDYTY